MHGRDWKIVDSALKIRQSIIAYGMCEKASASTFTSRYIHGHDWLLTALKIRQSIIAYGQYSKILFT